MRGIIKKQITILLVAVIFLAAIPLNAFADRLEIDYDDAYAPGSETAHKCATLTMRHPEFMLDYATGAEVRALPPEDRQRGYEASLIFYARLLSSTKRLIFMDVVLSKSRSRTMT